ncbi:catalase/peroxidase HPI [Pseudonocardia sp. D17]|uniref:catalase/peroxidase HPI n=1 Tax=Pseudonocardia sp. D17 TaxID=882661 RepID=UPI002B3B0CA2|nr:catalase-peroxidase 3 [Pseudonocardia sp. D17]
MSATHDVSATYDVVLRTRNAERAALPHPTRGGANRVWWPHRLDLTVLAPDAADPWAAGFDYGAAFETLDLAAVRRDIERVLTTSQPWWPADYGSYGPLMVRMAWHAAGTYRVRDGRGGARGGYQRFAPQNSWPDNKGLDKARRLLWPVKKRYGRALSWADLMIFAGTVALETMGVPTLGFGGGREDAWAPDDSVDWGPERAWLADERHTRVRELDEPLAASEMGLIYVNPEGPRSVPDPWLAGRDIRETFRRMGFDDEETVALIAGGHTFGKTHGAAHDSHLGPEPEGAPLEEQGLGWRNDHGTGVGPDAIVSSLEGVWTAHPTRWDHGYLETLYRYDWDAVLSPAGLWQWVPSGGAGAGTVPDAHDPAVTHVPTFLTTDLALRYDPGYEPVSRRFLERPDLFADAFAHAWFKLTHQDMGPIQCYRGPLVPAEPQLWQDRVPDVDHELVGPAEVADLKRRLLAAGPSVAQLVTTAWASASTFRVSDRRGGANGARIRLRPQRDWEVNEPARLAEVLDALEQVRAAAPHPVSLADLLVLGGCAAVERAAADAGHDLQVPFVPGRTDATQEQTDVDSFAALEPVADGFRQYRGPGCRLPGEHALVERAALLGLSAPETVVLLGGLRALGVTVGGSRRGVLTATPGVLTTDFFVNLLDPGTSWTPAGADAFDGRDRATGELRWTASRVDLAVGSNSELRAIAEVYAADDAHGRFVTDFAAAWDKVMTLDRFDLR